MINIRLTVSDLVVSVLARTIIRIRQTNLEPFVLFLELGFHTIEPDANSRRDRGVAFRAFTAKP